jgi:ABC-type Mn2+/Zn2+ transport system ATPase subunit
MSAAPPVLDARGVCVCLDGRSILEEVCVRVDPGQFVCLCGPNGGGKTTFVKAALGLVPTTAGTIELLGEPPARTRSHVGYVPQRTTFDRQFPATVAELITSGLRRRWPLRVRQGERLQATAILRRVGGEALLDKPLASLSGGETQRAFLARALAGEPSLLVLDEPTAGVDARGRGEFLDLMADVASGGGTACLMVTHNRAAVDRLADEVVYLDHKVVACGPPTEVLGRAGNGSDLLGGHDHASHDTVCEED